MALRGKYLRVAAKQLWLGWRAWRSYRASFWLGIIGDLAWLLFTIVFFRGIYSHAGSIGGWPWSDVLVLIGTAHIVNGLYTALFESNVRRLSAGIKNGSLDRWLTYPVDVQLLLTFGRINLRGFLTVFIGAGITLYALSLVAFQPRLEAVAIYALLLVGAVIVRLAAAFLIETLAFFLVNVEILRALQNEFYGYATYPAVIYPGWVWKLVFTVLIPVLWMANVPAAAFRGPEKAVWWLFFPPFLLALSRKAFAFALRCYQSAGG